MTYSIPFTRFSLPNGRQSKDSMTTDDPQVAAAYERIFAAGFRMTVEMLQTGQISACIEDPGEGDYDCVIHPNGPGLPEALWRKAQQGKDEEDDETQHPTEEHLS